MCAILASSSETSLDGRLSGSRASDKQQPAAKAKEKPSFFKRLTSRSSNNDVADYLTNNASSSTTRVRTSVRMLKNTQMVQRRLQHIDERRKPTSDRRQSLEKCLELRGTASINSDAVLHIDDVTEDTMDDVSATEVCSRKQKRVVFYTEEDDELSGRVGFGVPASLVKLKLNL